jgi:hypothetical protein
MRSSETIDEVFQLTIYYACDVTLSVYPHRASLKNMPDQGGNRTYDHVPGGGAMGACAPPPLFLKVKKVPFFWAKVPQLQNEKSIS